MKVLKSNAYLYAEMLLLMLGVPVLLYAVIPLHYMLPALWLSALYCHLVYRVIVDAPDRIFWNRNAVTRANVLGILKRFVPAAILLTGLTLWFKPEMFLGFIRERPLWWAIVMVAYPVLSVVPQEIIFRSFFFARYRHIFRGHWAMIIASGVMFGAAHLIFQNHVAPLLCLVGGILFAHTYDKHRSLLLVSLEHALYGCFIFTLGLGRYFYHGAIGPQ